MASLDDDPRLVRLVVDNDKTFHNETLDSEYEKKYLTLLNHVDESHIFSRLSKSIAEALWLPESTVFMIGIGVFSSIAMRKYAIRYKDGGLLPLGLYVTGEQPSGSAKSRCLSVWQEPFFKISNELNKEISTKITHLSKSKEKSDMEEIIELRDKLTSHLFLTNSTSSGIEKSLIKTNGYFSCVSSEQGLFNTVLGLSFREGEGNNDSLLHGYNGEWFFGSRVGRESYSGRICGSFVMFAQDGSYAKVFNESKGTGLCERFLPIIEPDSMGARDFLQEKDIDPALRNEYQSICYQYKQSIEFRLDLDDLVYLDFSQKALTDIARFRNKLEPEVRQGGKYSHPSLRSYVSKINIPILKIAANLHVSSNEDKYMSNMVKDDYVRSAISICEEILESITDMFIRLGETGLKAEYEAVIEYLSRSPIPKSKREIHQTLKNYKAFSHVRAGKAEYIRGTVDKMVKEEILKENFLPSRGVMCYCLK